MVGIPVSFWKLAYLLGVGNGKNVSPWAALKNVDGFALRKSSYVAVCLHTLDVMRAGEVRKQGMKYTLER